MKWNIFSMSDLSQKGYEFSLLKRALENFSYCAFWNKQKTPEVLVMGFLINLFHLLRNFILHFVLFCMQSGINDLSPWKSLGYRLFQSTDVRTRKPPRRTSHIFCQILFFLFDVLVGVFNCVTIPFTSSKQPIIMTISLNISDSIKILSSSMQLFMSSHTAGFTFNLVIWYLDIIWENFLEASSLQIWMTLTFVFPWVNLVATDLSVTFQPLTADLGPCYLTVTPSPLIISIPIRWCFLCKILPYEMTQGHQK